MGTTKVKVMSRAAIACGKEVILTETQNSEARRVFSGIYDDAVNFCLEESDWSFCLKTSELTGTETTDEAQFVYEFTIPADFIRLQRPRPDDAERARREMDYDIASGKIYANESVIDLAYVSSVRGRTELYWPAAFAELVSQTLAEWSGTTLGLSQAKKDSVKNDRGRALFNAQSQDRAQRSSAKRRYGKWVQAHTGGNSWKARYGR